MIIIEIITCDDKKYPKLLKQISDMPKTLYVEGNVKLLNTISISIIGSRKCSQNGAIQAKKYAYDLASKGITIISGMALGIDTASHIGALEAGGKTIAVLGSGFKHIFPKENVWLFRRIIENNGAIISEYPPNTYACSKRFLERNRIISGMSAGTLVVEAEYRSGSGATARFAKKQKRAVWGTLNSINNIEDAKLIQNSEDIIEYLKEIKNKDDK